MSRPIEAIVYNSELSPDRLRGHFDTTKIFGGWQSGLETLSGCKQWKLRLRLVADSNPASGIQQQPRAGSQSNLAQLLRKQVLPVIT